MENKKILYTLMTDNSFQEGTGTVKEYINLAADLKIDTLALLDRNSIQDFVVFYKECKSKNINPIIGCKLSIESYADVQNFLRTSKNKKEINTLFTSLLNVVDVKTNNIKKYLFDSRFSNLTLLSDFLFSANDYLTKKNKGMAKSSVDKSFKTFANNTKKFLQEINISSEKIKKVNDEILVDLIKDFSLSDDFVYFTRDENEHIADMSVIANTNEGLQSIRELISIANLEGQYFIKDGVNREKSKFPVVSLDNFKKYAKGLTVILSGKNDIVLRSVNNNDKELSKELLQELKSTKNNILMGLSKKTEKDKPIFIEKENLFNESILDFSVENSVPVIAIQDVRYPNKEDFDNHIIKRTIILQDKLNSIKKEPKEFSGQYMKPTKDLEFVFSDYPEVVENTDKFINSININPELDISVLPKFPIPKGQTEEEYLEKLSKKGIEERLHKIFEKRWEKWLKSGAVDSDNKEIEFNKKLEEYNKRADIELEIINKMGFPGYFLIVQDFINWAKEKGIPVGPGRGSGAGSIVAYGLGITDIDPLEFGLLFERFLNPERVSMPDFDIDFHNGYDENGNVVGRDDVINYVANKYNIKGNPFPVVAQIATVGNMKAKSAIKDTGKAMGFELFYYEKLAKLVGDGVDVELGDALEESEELQSRFNSEKRTRELLNNCLFLENRKKSTGVHAGGVVISKGPVTNYAPIEYDKKTSKYVAQFDKNSVEVAGLVKFDFLGLKTLGVIAETLKLINKNGEKFDFELIDIDDEATFEFMRTGKTHSMFQIESQGMRDLVKKLEIQNFEELSALLALFRPGPLESGMVEDFIERKHGRQKTEYPHPALEKVLNNTYGVILYQEQVMQIAQVLANYSLGEADLLRRAMGKKKPEEMAKQRDFFLKGARNNKINEDTANHIFDLMEKFAGYGFNKSHSVAYAMVSYQTAYLKTHYMNEFMTAVLTSKMTQDIEKLEDVISECRSLGLRIVKPNVNTSHYAFSDNYKGHNKAILFGLGGIKGGGSSVNEIINEREKNGPFSNLKDILLRVGKKHANKGTMLALIKSGALDTLPLSFPEKAEGLLPKDLDKNEGVNLKRSLLNHEFTECSAVMPTAIEMKKIEKEKGQKDFKKEPSIDYKKAIENKMDDRVRLLSEKEVMGAYMTGHPFDISSFRERLSVNEPKVLNLGNVDQSLAEEEDKVYKVGGVISKVIVRTIAKDGPNFGRKLATVSVEDGNGEFEITVFPDQYDIYKDYIEEGNVVAFKGNIKEDGFSKIGLKMNAQDMISLIPYKVFEERPKNKNNFKKQKSRV